MLQIVRYTADYKSQWDDLITRSRNGTFLFYRDYMDYHKHIYTDCSFLLFKGNKVEAIIPGTIEGNCYHSHIGLTFGGIISSVNIHTTEIIETFCRINEELKKLGVQIINYKPVPLVYHKIPAQEDIYALFINKADKIGCNISSAILQANKISFHESRKSGIRKCLNAGVQISESNDFSAFWDILEYNLQNKYKVKPVHSLHEIELLNNRFPENIKLFVAKLNEMVVGGSVLYLMNHIIRVQYIAANEIGKENGALDLLFDHLINKEYIHIPVFDIGQSTEEMGLYLNENLIFQKEGFGGRGIVYEIYKYSI
jgi:hypothetical protein